MYTLQKKGTLFVHLVGVQNEHLILTIDFQQDIDTFEQHFQTFDANQTDCR